MNENKAFCDGCRKDVAYTISTKQMEGRIKGRNYSYEGKVAYCANCKEDLYVSEVNDFNLKALYDVYRETNGIISFEMILEIPKKYAIGKRPISLLLGWGEQTFSRYCEGDMPTKQYSDILKKIYDDPNYYDSILERNKENLKNETTYKKSKKAVSSLIALNTSSKTNIDASIKYLLSKCEDITPLALQKALYYIQGFYYAFHKTFIFEEDCQAWVHGPVYRDVYLRYKDYKFDPITSVIEFDDSNFTLSQKAILDSVAKYVCCYSGKVLEKFTHSEYPWILTRGELPPNASSDKIISKEQIGRYFSDVKEKYNMMNPNDIRCYTQKMFEKIDINFK